MLSTLPRVIHMHSAKVVTQWVLKTIRLTFPSPLTIPLPRDTELSDPLHCHLRYGMMHCSPWGLVSGQVTHISVQGGRLVDGDLKPHSHAWHSPYPHSQLLHKPAKHFAFFFFKAISISICLPLKSIRYIFKFHSNPHKSFLSLISHYTWLGPHSSAFSALSIFHIGL